MQNINHIISIKEHRRHLFNLWVQENDIFVGGENFKFPIINSKYQTFKFLCGWPTKVDNKQIIQRIMLASQLN
jgi:hypothetical protein